MRIPARVVAAALPAAFLVLMGPGFDDARAQYPEAGRMYLSFTPDGSVQDMTVDALTPFDFYLIVDVDLSAGDPNGAFALIGGLDFSTEIFVSQIEWAAPTIDIGQGLSSGRLDFVFVFDGECVPLADGPNVACHFRAMLLESAVNLFVGVSAAIDYPDLGPGWIACNDIEQLLAFRTGGAPRGLAINGPTAVESMSFAAVKSLYR